MNESKSCIVDVIIVGGGFSGLFMLHRMQENGFSVKLLETGSSIGGTWSWNKYPGARCDVDSFQYSYWFSEELQKSWRWSERHASQIEILQYLNHFIDMFDLRKNIELNSHVTSVVFDERISRWSIQSKCGKIFSAKFCVLATGVLTDPKLPVIKGLDNFNGRYCHPSRWPDGVNLVGKRVAIIGTGPTGVQCIPIVAEQASHLFVFQRTPNYCVPFRNRTLTDEDDQWWKTHYAEQRKKIQNSRFGFISDIINNFSSLEVTEDEREQTYEKLWEIGGFGFQLAFNDLLSNEESNDIAANFVRRKILDCVKDANIARLLLPFNHRICTKRLCLGNNYYETFNRENVTLVDIRDNPIDEITPFGIKVKDKLYEVDYIIFATGFVSLISSLMAIDIRGRENQSLKMKWSNGTRNLLGLMVEHFPNLFMINCPGSPSVLGNMIISIENRVDWISNCLCYMRNHNYDTIEPTLDAENAWIDHLDELASETIFSTITPFYTRLDDTNKPKNFLLYAVGMDSYRKECENVASNNYSGFHFCKTYAS